ncbi:MAG: hypothetical protein H6739_29105 [Alphaproteobacteria bacterium]|nr:hypothetical protein [Alphaproteobacteria bacterium]
MKTPFNARDLALMLGAGLLGLLAAKSVEPAQAQQSATAEVCKQWELTTWHAELDERCTISMKNPINYRANNWCAAPEGTEIVQTVPSSSTTFWIKRCKQ